ncbi:MAG TPA: energy transducer TonB [Pyrinomonadaceae bacterium]|nr:energy transducer TonB [Pyrinomonadaceae bacterium]
MFLRKRSTLALLVFVVFVCSSALADQWALPNAKKYYSPDKKYRLEVIPKKLQSQLAYFEDKSEGKQDAGAVKNLKDNRAKAIFSVRNGPDYSKKYEFPLVNEVAPVFAIVSKDGNYVVTFDNWHMMGFGDDVVVIYKSDGTLIRKFGLEDLFTEADIGTFRRSVSSIWWWVDEHYIDDKSETLHLKPGTKELYRELKIELATGRPLEPKRDLFPELQQHQTVAIEPAAVPANFKPLTERCANREGKFDATDALRIPPEEFRSKIKKEITPPYPPIARAAKVEGKVIVEAVVSKTGEVICVRALEGHPLLVGVAVQAVGFWPFESFDTPENVSKVVGTVAVTFKLQ